MKLKKYTRFEMDFQSRWSVVSAAFIGLSFFLRIVYYFAFINLEDVGSGVIFGSLALPLVLCFVYILLFRVLKWNAPGIYAILGSTFCLILMVWNFSSGDGLRIFFSIFGYLAAALALLATAYGYMPNKVPVIVIFAMITLVRFLFYSFQSTEIVPLVYELSAVSIPASLTALSFCFKPYIRKPAAK